MGGASLRDEWSWVRDEYRIQFNADFPRLRSANRRYDPFADIRPLNILFTAWLTGPVVFGLSTIIQHRILSLLITPPIGFFVYSTLEIRIQAVDPWNSLKWLSNFLIRLHTIQPKLSRELNRE